MFISYFGAQGFRNLAPTELEFSPTINIFTGNNAQGKTNLLEALVFLFTQSSFRHSNINDLLAFEQPAFLLEARVQYAEVEHTFVAKMERGGRKSCVIDGKRRKIGGAVVFQPDDLLLIKGAPELRRRYFDGLISRLDPVYHSYKQDYSKLLFKRNRLLVAEYCDSVLLEAYTEQMIATGLRVIERRITFIKQLAPLLSSTYSYLADDNCQVYLKYQSSITFVPGQNPVETYLNALNNCKYHLEKTAVGPHRDDFSIYLNERRAKEFASQGQIRSLVLALKKSELELWDNKAILVLDDLFSELDSGRIERFLAHIDHSTQVFISGTFIPEMIKNSRNFSLQAGQVTKL